MNSAVLEFTIKNQELLLEFLYNNIKNKSKNNIKSLLNRGNVFVNNKSITKFDYKLNINDKILIKLKQINDKNNNRILDIIYEDNDIIVINKPHNLLSISTEKEKSNTAYKLVMEYLK
ncbi:MAG: RNA pseudouridine synthase, partial [Bacilli bacterium]|nr:RNA pseudouridine synthase [Bacilli bacterium]